MKAVVPSLEKTFYLSEWDPENETWIKVRQVRAGEQHRFEEETWAREVSYDQGGGGPVTEKQRPSIVKVWLARAKLTFVDSNLQVALMDKNGQPEKDKEGNIKTQPLFTQNMSEREFTKVWSSLPVDLVEEWDKKVVEMNPHWGGREFQCPDCGYVGQMDLVEISKQGE
jgi:hypothetical protein